MKPKAVDPLGRVLAALLENGSVPRSTAGAQATAKMQTLFDCGALTIARRGAGDVIQIVNRDALDRFVVAAYPSGLHWGSNAPTRADGVLYARNSKRGTLDFSLVNFQGTTGGWRMGGCDYRLVPGKPEAIFLDDPDKEQPVFFGIETLALIENLEVFRRYSDAGINASMAIWTGGKMPDRLIRWLAGRKWESASVILHCGDYDVVGLREFDRIYAVLGQRAKLFVPDHIEELFKRPREGMSEGQGDASFQSFLKHQDADCQRVAKLIFENGGLEQEILLAT